MYNFAAGCYSVVHWFKTVCIFCSPKMRQRFVAGSVSLSKFYKMSFCINIKCIRLYYIYSCIVFVMKRCCLLWCKQTSLSVHHLPFCQSARMKKNSFNINYSLSMDPWRWAGLLRSLTSCPGKTGSGDNNGEYTVHSEGK